MNPYQTYSSVGQPGFRRRFSVHGPLYKIRILSEWGLLRLAPISYVGYIDLAMATTEIVLFNGVPQHPCFHSPAGNNLNW